MRTFAQAHCEEHKAAGTYRNKEDMAERLSDVLLPIEFDGRVIPTAKRVREWFLKEGPLRSFGPR